MNVRPFYLWPWLPEDRGQDPGLRQCRSSECGVVLGVISELISELLSEFIDDQMEMIKETVVEAVAGTIMAMIAELTRDWVGD